MPRHSSMAANLQNPKENKMKMRAFVRWAMVSALVAGSAGAQAQTKRAITFEDMIQLHRVAEPQISPDGKWIAYSLATPDMDANRNASSVWIVPTAGGAPVQLTQSGKDSSPVWSPDGKTIAFLSSRSGDSQVYLMSMEGGEPQ